MKTFILSITLLLAAISGRAQALYFTNQHCADFDVEVIANYIDPLTYTCASRNLGITTLVNGTVGTIATPPATLTVGGTTYDFKTFTVIVHDQCSSTPYGTIWARPNSNGPFSNCVFPGSAPSNLGGNISCGPPCAPGFNINIQSDPLPLEWTLQIM